MYISEEEYLELKNRIEELNQKISLAGRPSNLASMIKTYPFSYITSRISSEGAVFQPSKMAQDAWSAFLKLGKYIHQDTCQFYMDETYRYSGVPYIRQRNNTKTPKTISEMTTEQMELSARMLDEMIEIYNRYFQVANPYVLYDKHKRGIYERVEITYPED